LAEAKELKLSEEEVTDLLGWLNTTENELEHAWHMAQNLRDEFIHNEDYSRAAVASNIVTYIIRGLAYLRAAKKVVEKGGEA